MQLLIATGNRSRKISLSTRTQRKKYPFLPIFHQTNLSFLRRIIIFDNDKFDTMKNFPRNYCNILFDPYLKDSFLSFLFVKVQPSKNYLKNVSLALLILNICERKAFQELFEIFYGKNEWISRIFCVGFFWKLFSDLSFSVWLNFISFGKEYRQKIIKNTSPLVMYCALSKFLLRKYEKF